MTKLGAGVVLIVTYAIIALLCHMGFGLPWLLTGIVSLIILGIFVFVFFYMPTLGG